MTRGTMPEVSLSRLPYVDGVLTATAGGWDPADPAKSRLDAAVWTTSIETPVEGFAKEPGFTYDRRWLISEYIFDNRFASILGSTPRAQNREGKPVPVSSASPCARWRTSAEVHTPIPGRARRTRSASPSSVGIVRSRDRSRGASPR